ncbi:UrcA family protein [Methylorubrum thiocyanatum]
MSVRAALLLGASLLASPAEAAPFDNLKDDLAACLRFELDATRSQRSVPMNAKAGLALQKCSGEMDRLERADPRRLRSDHGLSPSSWSVIESVFGAGSRGRFAGILFRARG